MNQLSPNMPRADVALPVVLQRTSFCLSQISLRILALEQHVIQGNDQTDHSSVNATALQSFDFIKQATEDIASMLDRLADTVSQNAEVNRAHVLDLMSLQELRDVIGVHGTDDKSNIAFFTGKTVELF